MNSISSDYQGFTCWTTRSADDIFVVDAPMASDGVFAATHLPMQIAERSYESFADKTSGTLVSESYLMERLLEESPSGLTFLPIVGESGTGKSHLVRWVYSQLPEDENRKDVYIKRYQTSLRSVIEEMLRGLEGDIFDDVRHELATASAGVNRKSAPRRLLSELANTILDDSSESDSEEQAFLKQAWSRILGDPVITAHFLDQDSKIESFIAKRLAGATSRETSQLRLEVTDLPTHSAHWQQAAEPTRRALGRINAEAALRTASLELLNEHLESAIQSLFGVGGRDLRSVFVAARRALWDAGMELLIAVEDFVVLQGIQGDLLDALLEPAKRGGKFELCPVRALLAVTTGYFTGMLPDTAETRAKFTGSVYSLDIDISTSGLDQHSISRDSFYTFIAQYLNAVRLGPDTLDAAYAQATDTTWVPNACEDCRFRETCHEGFGEIGGFGLYPLNRELLDTVAHRIGRAFDPRQLMNVTRRVLSCASAIEDGRFPDGAFESAMPQVAGEGIDNLVSQDIDQRDTQNAGRRKLLLEYWGGNPATLVNLKPAIHAAFALPELRLVGTPKKPTNSQIDQSIGQPQGGPQLKPETEALIRDVNRWSKKDRLVQGPARRVRELLARNLITSIDWNAEFASEPDVWLNEVFGSFAISLDNAQGEGLSRPPDTFLVKVESSADSALLIEGLARYEEFGHWSFPRGSDFHRRFLNWADTVAAGLLDRLHARAEQVVGPLTELLALESVILGTEVNGSPSLVEIKDLTLAKCEGAVPHGVAGWRRLMKNSLDGPAAGWDRARMLKEIEFITGARQGKRGDIHAVDFARLQPHLESVVGEWLPPTPDGRLPSALDKHLRVIHDLYDKALEEQIQSLKDFHLRVGLLIDPDQDVEDVSGTFIEAASEAVVTGLFRPRHLEGRYRAIADELRHHNLGVIRGVGNLIGSVRKDRLTVLSAAATDRGAAIDVILSFAQTADEILAATSEKVLAEISDISGGSNEELAVDLAEVLTRLEEVLNELTD